MKSNITYKTICNNFWLLIQKVNWEYEKKLEEIEPEDRYEYFALALQITITQIKDGLTLNGVLKK